MTPEQILSHPARVLTQEQRESYFNNGYILVEKAINEEWLERLHAAIARQIEMSCGVTRSDAIFDLEPNHTADNPRLRRVSSPNDQDPVFWDFVTDSALGDIMADLLGPDVKFYQSKLNFKWAQGGTEVKWHQDCPFFPHTNAAMLTVGLYLNDCGPDQGPLKVIPGSHEGPLYDHYDEHGEWRGALSDEDAATLPLDSAEMLCGPAGSLTIHNYRTVHGSEPNRSDQGRPLLLNVLSAADAMGYTPNPLPSKYAQAMVRGKPARWAHHDPRPCLIPPDWSGGYTSIFSSQQGEDDDREAATG
ncbi:MAG: phytanoyl-CoA dioxygenase family protein [Halofilum sp. (in: g-proteobacteria)]|nr:phytanoyl-CoA dioxygenase family protein [Halofilum sp. (in: g-proteobacteria)]